MIRILKSTVKHRNCADKALSCTSRSEELAQFLYLFFTATHILYSNILIF